MKISDQQAMQSCLSSPSCPSDQSPIIVVNDDGYIIVRSVCDMDRTQQDQIDR